MLGEACQYICNDACLVPKSRPPADRREAASLPGGVATALCQGSARAAEALFGWRRGTVAVGLEEARSGITRLGNFQARGGKKMEALRPQLEADIRALADPHSQADAHLKTALAYTRLSARSVRRALVAEKGWAEEELPAERTMTTILNRLGYRLRSVTKTRPEKKHPGARPSSPTWPRGERPPTSIQRASPEFGHQGKRGPGGVLAPGPGPWTASRAGP